MTAYTIVNLAWRESEPGFWQADSVFGDLAVGEFGRRVRVWVDGKEIRAIAGGTLEDGKAKAEAYYRERLLSALVPVSASIVICANCLRNPCQCVDGVYFPHDEPSPEGRT